MPGYIPPPPPAALPGKLGFNGQAPLPVPSSGSGLTLVQGVGLVGRTDAAGGRLLLDAARADAAEVFGIYTPGVIAAGNLGVWRNSRASKTAVGTMLEANLATPQTTADVANYYALKAADTSGTVLQLPFTTANAGHYSLDKANGQIIAQPTSKVGGSAFRDNSSIGALESFSPTQGLVITGLYMAGGLVDASNIGQARQLRAQLLDAQLNVLATAYATPAASNAVQDIYFGFPLSLTLAQGTVYHVGVDVFNSVGTEPSNNPIGFNEVSGGTAQSAPITGGGGYSGKCSTKLTTMNPAGFEWANVAPASSANNNFWSPGSIGFPFLCLGLVGSGGAATFAGDITLSIVTVGAPVATAAGSGLNSRLVLQPGA